MYYVIRRDDGAFCTPSGSEHSYTHKLQKAALFGSQEAAQRHGLCGNERVVPIEACFEFGVQR